MGVCRSGVYDDVVRFVIVRVGGLLGIGMSFVGSLIYTLRISPICSNIHLSMGGLGKILLDWREYCDTKWLEFCLVFCVIYHLVVVYNLLLLDISQLIYKHIVSLTFTFFRT